MKKNQRHPRTRERALVLYNWVREYQRENHCSPTFGEISAAVSLSTSHIKHIRDAMVEFGLMWPVPPYAERTWNLKRIPKEFQDASMPNMPASIQTD